MGVRAKHTLNCCWLYFTAVNCKVCEGCDSLCWLVGRAHEQNEYVFSFSLVGV